MKRRASSGEGQSEGQNKGFEDLKAWQLARRLMVECHALADCLPSIERYDLISQIRRSSKSVMANIAEGYGRYQYLDSLRFYYIARGSLEETINHIVTAHDLAYIDDTGFQLNGYIGYVRRLKVGSETYGDRYIPTPDEPLTSIEE